MKSSATDPITTVVRSIHAMADGDLADFAPLYQPDAADGENRIQPPASRVPGAAGFFQTALWLRAANSELHYEIHHTLAGGDLVAVDSTMHGRQTGDWAFYTDEGDLDTVFPATGRMFAMTQSHWFRVRDGRIVRHWANRDDLGVGRQLHWIPPTPLFLVKMARAKRRVRSMM
jgi:predicted ester cyclase